MGTKDRSVLGRVVLSLLAALALLPARADWADDFRYRYYGISEGLCDEYVISTYMDGDGYLWICTSNGLDRFDGHRFVHYNTLSKDPSTKIDNNHIYGVTEDGMGGIWMVSNTGLQKIDKKRNVIVTPDQMDGFGDVLEGQMIGIVGNGPEEFWLLKRASLVRVSLAGDGSISQTRVFPLKKNGQRMLSITDNVIYLGGLEGVEAYRIQKNGELTALDDNLLAPVSGIPNVSYVLAGKTNLWVGTENGMFRYNLRTRELRSFRHEEGNPQSISDNHVTCLAFDEAGNLLIGTTTGIDRYTPEGQFSHMTQGRRNHSLNTTFVNNIMVDRNGTIWVSTLVGGVNRISPEIVNQDVMFTTEKGVANVISCAYQDKEGNIFVGILGKGLGIRSAADGQERIYSLKEYAGVSQEDIFSITQDRRGDFWFCTRYDGLIRMNGKGLSHPSFSHYSTWNSKVGSDHIFDMVYDDVLDGLWLSAIEGVYFFDIKTLTSRKTVIRSLPGQDIRFFCLLLDRDRTLWMGGYGLCAIELGREAVEDSYDGIFFPSMNKRKDSYLERINSLTQADDGTIYIGSNNNGIYELQEDASFRNWPLVKKTAAEYLTPPKVTKILADRTDGLWIASTSGVFHLNRTNGATTHFGINDGFPSNNCYTNSGNVFSDDVMAFGTSNGLILLEAPYMKEERMANEVRITEIWTNGEPDVWPRSDELDIYPENTSFELVFSSLELTDNDRVMYAYRLDELGDDFTYTPTGSVRFNNIKPGNYTFRVRSSAEDDFWTDTESDISDGDTLIHIRVHPKFTQTLFFWILIFSVILVLLAVIMIMNLRNKANKHRELEKQVAEKTEDLTAAMANLLESKSSIEKQNVLLEEQKAKLEEYAASIEKANKEKLMLYTNLTHEFKTPLSLILGPVSDIKGRNNDPDVQPSLNIIERNSKYLLSLVNQILDLRKVDSGQLNVRKDKLHIPSFLSIFSSDFIASFSKRNVRFETVLRLKGNSIVTDRDILFKIITNLISNALKYTPDGGKVSFCMAQVKGSNDRLFQYVSVSNTGSYITPEECSRIFDCFYKSESRQVYDGGSQGSTGIGLYLVRNLVSALGGQISVKSSEKAGTSFRLYFPVELAADDNIDNTAGAANTAGNVPVLLLVEDNDDMRNYIRSMLIDRFQVIEAQNGERGYQMARQTIPDFIISDLMMPVCDGLEFCRMVRADSMLCHIPFLMLTALSGDDTRLNSYKEGVNAFLVKPFKKDMLLTRINNILNDRKLLQEELSYDLKNSYARVNIDRSDKAFMEQLMNVLKDNYTDPEFNVPRLQSLMCMSMTPFYKKVNSLTGLTPAMLIRQYRLQTAKAMMETNRDKGINVSEIAYMVGFNDPKYFSKCFQKEYHIRPSSLFQPEMQENSDIVDDMVEHQAGDDQFEAGTHEKA